MAGTLVRVLLVTLLLVSDAFCRQAFWRKRRSPTNKMADPGRLTKLTSGGDQTENSARGKRDLTYRYNSKGEVYHNYYYRRTDAPPPVIP